MVKKKLVTVTPGEIYAIPLFVQDRSPLIRFAKKDWQTLTGPFGYMRIIEDRAGAGIVIEVLNVFGDLKMDVSQVANSRRLFRPIVITGLELYKKRWPLLGQQPDYDRERDSEYSRITLVLSPTSEPVLWKGGVKAPISLTEAAKHEPWTMWSCLQVEKRIVEAAPQAVQHAVNTK